MNVRNRLGVAVATVALGIAGMLSLSACTPGVAAAAMSPEQSALTALGFTSDDVTPAVASATAAATPGAAGNGKHRQGRLRRLALRRIALSKKVEHGEITVQTKKGDQTIEVQRGTVTAITSTSVTVKSADGFTLTWTFGTPINVIEHRQTVQPSAVTVGETVGVAGLAGGTGPTARLLVIPKQNTTAGS